jgi:hypothetical protein
MSPVNTVGLWWPLDIGSTAFTFIFQTLHLCLQYVNVKASDICVIYQSEPTLSACDEFYLRGVRRRCIPAQNHSYHSENFRSYILLCSNFYAASVSQSAKILRLVARWKSTEYKNKPNRNKESEPKTELLLATYFTLVSSRLIQPEDWGDVFLRNVGWHNWLHIGISQHNSRSNSLQ